MTIHVLDIIVWVLLLFVIWYLMDWIFGGEFTRELGGLVGLCVLAFFTIIYIVIFGIMGYDVVNIKQLIDSIPIKFQL